MAADTAAQISGTTLATTLDYGEIAGAASATWGGVALGSPKTEPSQRHGADPTNGQGVPFLDYYTRLGFVPTRQTGSATALFRRREELYLRLGLPPALFRGADILEFGPGSGENSSFTASLDPRSYHVVDALEAALDATREQLKRVGLDDDVTFTQATIEDFASPSNYDIVLCEGLLPFQTDPSSLLVKVAGCVRPGGVVVITCADTVSMLPESLRRYLARRLVRNGLVDGDQTDFMVEFFSEDLDALPGMTRNRRDWVIDQLMHPWTGRTFSMADALQALRTEFRPTGASPSVFADWRWYKDYESANCDWVDLCIAEFNLRNAALVDRRQSAHGADSELSVHLQEVGDFCYTLVCEGGSTFDATADEELHRRLRRLIAIAPSLQGDTRDALESFLRFLDSSNPVDLAEFRPWWGLGQQYLALTRVLQTQDSEVQSG